MLVPENIVAAVHAATNHAEVAEAQRMRDAEFWAHAYTWRAPSRFKRDKFYASKLRARGPEVARKYRAKYGDRAERALLDIGHLVRNNVEVTLCAAAIHYLRRNP